MQPDAATRPQDRADFGTQIRFSGMKLLFDHHLSRKLVGRLDNLFPGSSHAAFHGLSDAENNAIWTFAARKATRSSPKIRTSMT